MGKIKGKFAPLTEELGNDERFILECSDFEKLMYMLIIYTTHMTRHAAPVDPAYYHRRYGLRTRGVRIKAAIDTLLVRFPNLKCTDGKLSLLNSATYKSQIVASKSLESELESEVEVEVEKESEGDSFLNSQPNPPNKKQKVIFEPPEVRQILTEPEESEMRVYLHKFFDVRGWVGLHNLEEHVFEAVAKKVENYEPRLRVPYFKTALQNHINQNAEWISNEVKKYRIKTEECST